MSSAKPTPNDLNELKRENRPTVNPFAEEREIFNKSFNRNQLKIVKSNEHTSEVDVSDMAKTSKFGGLINSAELPVAPLGKRLVMASAIDDATADSCFSVKGSSMCLSPSPDHKQEMTENREKFSLGFLERMAQQ